MDGRLRFKASRPVYRRGGLVLGSAGWVVVDHLTALTPAGLLALAEDPIVTFEIEQGGDLWSRPGAYWRAEIAENLRAMGHEWPTGEYQAPAPAPAGDGGIDQATAVLVADAGGAGATPPADVTALPVAQALAAAIDGAADAAATTKPKAAKPKAAKPKAAPKSKAAPAQ